MGAKAPIIFLIKKLLTYSFRYGTIKTVKDVVLDSKEDKDMTREQKIEWLTNADTQSLLNQYEAATRRADNVWEILKHDDRYTLEGIFEDLELTRAEVVRRMTK